MMCINQSQSIISFGQLPDPTPLKGVFGLKKVRLKVYRSFDIETADIKQLGNGCIGHGCLIQTGHSIHALQALSKGLFLVFADQINLVNNDPISKRYLRQHLIGLIIQMLVYMLAINKRNNSIELIEVLNIFLY